MALTFPRALPTVPGIASCRFKFVANTEPFRSPLSGALQSRGRPGGLWTGYYVFAPKRAEEVRILKAWLMSMNGVQGTFYGYDVANRNPSGNADTGLDTILVQGAGQTGKILVCDGARFSGVDLLKVGDYFQIGNTGTAIQLKMMTEDASSDGAGNIVLNFEPELQASPANNAPIIFNDPVGVFVLAKNDSAEWEAKSDTFTAFAFAFEEVPQTV